jgi:hypothetical protein
MRHRAGNVFMQESDRTDPNDDQQEGFEKLEDPNQSQDG